MSQLPAEAGELNYWCEASRETVIWTVYDLSA
jgi:hypothetical protein